MHIMELLDREKSRLEHFEYPFCSSFTFKCSVVANFYYREEIEGWW